MSYLWMIGLVMRLFSCGANLWRSSASIQSKKVQPLEFYFWHVRLGLLKSPFLVGEAEHMWLYPFCKDKCLFRKKKACFAIWARWHKILEFVPSCPICGWLAWRWDFFPVGSAFEDYPASIQSKKGPAPWILFLTPAPRPLQVTFLVGEAEHVCLYPFARTTVFSAKKICVLQIARALTQNSWIRPIMSYLWMIGLVMRLFSCGANLWRSSASIQSKKVQPLGFYFWPLRLGLLKSLFLVVKVNICVCTLLQSHVKNHTPSSNHGTFFSWGSTFRYVLVNSHLIHPPSNSWLLTLGILQTYPLSESFMIDFLMPYIHRLIDQPPQSQQTEIDFLPLYVRKLSGKKTGPFLVWYLIPGPVSCPWTLTHCLLDFWKIVFFKKRTEPPGKKKAGSTEEDIVEENHTEFITVQN